MTWKMDQPLVTLSDSAKVQRDIKLWESEDLGGITEDNNRIPLPVVWLVALTVLTAFAITFPLWGQRPTAALYVDAVKAMDKPEIQAKSDGEAISTITAMYKGGEEEALFERHPVTMDDLRIIKPQIEALEKQGVDMKDYEVVGQQVVKSNFEGNYRPDGTRIRQQPWWDKGYTIDIFYVIYFFLAVTIIIKRLPPSTWQPVHGTEH